MTHLQICNAAAAAAAAAAADDQPDRLAMTFRVPWRCMYDAVVRLDNAAFQSADDVRAVLQCVPSQDEGNMLQSYVRAGGTLQGLSDAELFCLDLMKVSHDSYQTYFFFFLFQRLSQLRFLNCPTVLPGSCQGQSIRVLLK